MRNCFLCYLAIATLLSFISCSQDDPAEEDVRKEVKVTATFKGLSAARNATTRVTDNSWENVDAIGLFMMKSGVALDQDALANNVKYTFDSGEIFNNASENKIYFPFNKEKVDFISYYPFRETLNDLTYEIDVSSQANLSDIDLLYSDNVKSANSTHDVINLHFKHQLSKVIINLDAGDTENDLNVFTATITNVNRKASFLLCDGSITIENDSGDIDFHVDNENKRAEAILLPNDDLSESELFITVDGVSYSLSLKNTTTGNAFDQSQKYTYSIKLREGQGPVLDGLTATIEDWTDNKIDDVYADEVPASEDGENSNPAEDEGEGEIDEGEVNNPENPEDDGNSETDIEGEAGTKENPYTIAQLLEKMYKEDATSEEYLVYENEVWIEGYIVGGYNSKNEFSINYKTYPNIALADLSPETSGDKTFAVDLSKNNGCPSKFSDVLKLTGNDNLSKKVLLLGDIGDLKIGASHANQRPGIINLQEAFLEGVEIKK